MPVLAAHMISRILKIITSTFRFWATKFSQISGRQINWRMFINIFPFSDRIKDGKDLHNQVIEASPPGFF